MHDVYISGRSENYIKCIVHDDLGGRTEQLDFCRITGFTSDRLSFIGGTYSILSRSPSIVSVMIAMKMMKMMTIVVVHCRRLLQQSEYTLCHLRESSQSLDNRLCAEAAGRPPSCAGDCNDPQPSCHTAAFSLHRKADRRHTCRLPAERTARDDGV